MPGLFPANRMTPMVPPTIAKCRITARPPLFLSGAHRLGGDSLFDQRIGASLGSARPGIVSAWRAGLHCDPAPFTSCRNSTKGRIQYEAPVHDRARYRRGRAAAGG